MKRSAGYHNQPTRCWISHKGHQLHLLFFLGFLTDIPGIKDNGLLLILRTEHFI